MRVTDMGDENCHSHSHLFCDLMLHMWFPAVVWITKMISKHEFEQHYFLWEPKPVSNSNYFYYFYHIISRCCPPTPLPGQQMQVEIKVDSINDSRLSQYKLFLMDDITEVLIIILVWQPKSIISGQDLKIKQPLNHHFQRRQITSRS